MECEKAVKEVEQELRRFRTGEDVGPLIRQLGFIDLVTNIKSSPLKINHDSSFCSPFLCLDGLVTASSLDSNHEVQELYEDIKVKVSEFGKVIGMVIPIPPLGIKGLDVFGKGKYGKAFVQFETIAAAESTKKALHGMIFDGRAVIVESISEVTFTRALGI